MVINQKSNKTSAIKGKPKELKKEITAVKSNKIPGNYFDILFENAGVYVMLLDLKRNILNTNPAFQKLLKYTGIELSGLTLKKITHPEDYRKEEKLLKDLAIGKKTKCTIEKRYITKDGDFVYTRNAYSLTCEYKGVNKSIIAIVENTAWQKLFESKLAYEQNFLDALLQNSPDQIYFKDTYSRFLKVSTALAKKHNLTVDDLIDKTDFDVFGETHARNAFEDEKEIIRTGIPVIGKEEKEEWPDGRIAWVSTSKMPFYDKEGNLIGTFGISRDVTLKKRAEQGQEAVFRISETAFTSPDMQSLFRRIHEVVGMLMSAKNLSIALYNEKEDILSFPYFVDQYNNQPEPSKPNKGITEYVLRTGKATLINKARLKELSKSGELEITGVMPKTWLGVPLKLSNSIMGVIAVQDYEQSACYSKSEMQLFTFIAEQIAQVIERMRSSDEITRYAEELKQLNATKDRFFTIIAHDLKNPFITIMGFTDLLYSDYADLTDEERLSFILEMKKSAELSFNLLQNLLLWSRSQTGKIEFKPAKLELINLVSNNLLLIANSAEQKRIRLINNVLPDIYIKADEEMINTVLRNLLTNAVKFSNLEGSITTNAAVYEKFVEISITDCGVGMNPKTVENLFRLDVAHSTIGTQNETGTGLGLILCKEFIEKNGGSINVESEIGKGTKFTFTLPA